MVILICGTYPIYDNKGIDTGRKEFCVSHGIDSHTGENIVLPQVHPSVLGVKIDKELNEFCLKEEE